MIGKKRITNSSSVKGTLFFVHNLCWICSRKGGKKKENGKTKRRKQKINNIYKQL